VQFGGKLSLISYVAIDGWEWRFKGWFGSDFAEEEEAEMVGKKEMVFIVCLVSSMYTCVYLIGI